MTALTSGLHFLSGIALQFGALSAHSVAQADMVKRRRRRAKSANRPFTPLSERQRKELLDSIRHDDWAE
jgi:hypothetical protein